MIKIDKKKLINTILLITLKVIYYSKKNRIVIGNTKDGKGSSEIEELIGFRAIDSILIQNWRGQSQESQWS